MALDVQAVRRQFSVFAGKDAPLYFDSAATAQTPDAVIEAMDEYYRTYCANVHRGMHALTERATLRYEEARKTVGAFINAKYPREIVFTKNCTESINLVARAWGEQNLRAGDAVLLSLLEHHSNIVPWLQLKERRNIAVEWMEIDDVGRLKMESLGKILGKGKVKLVAITGQSNVLGVRPDLQKIIRMAHDAGARTLVDAAQLIAHHPVDVQALGCDFLAFSGHKLYGPTGIGVLYGKRDLLEEMPPFLGGGMMIHEVKTDRFSPAEPPQRFEAGTPPIAQAIGLAAAIEWVKQFPWKEIETYERSLIRNALTLLGEVEGLTILGPKDADAISCCISFTADGVHPHDLTDILGQQQIAMRAGHHCAQPLHEKLGVPATTRLSIGMYNTAEELETLKVEMQKALDLLR